MIRSVKFETPEIDILMPGFRNRDRRESIMLGLEGSIFLAPLHLVRTLRSTLKILGHSLWAVALALAAITGAVAAFLLGLLGWLCGRVSMLVLGCRGRLVRHDTAGHSARRV